ncbi:MULTISPECIES: hypothetical protein [Hyphomicrobiales]|jgi:hypothetical protein|uniref:hypothetical protein n=1 Tax=Hyphomicrobiales TaxID=356 RepID=UPI0011B24944|nr:hypothetical protein [Phreatobacter cathodiphilus]
MSTRARRLICLLLAVLVGLSGPAFWRGAGSSHAATASTISAPGEGHGHSHSHDHDGDSSQSMPHGPDHSHVTLGLAQPSNYVIGPVRVAIRPLRHAAPALDVVMPFERPPRTLMPR